MDVPGGLKIHFLCLQKEDLHQTKALCKTQDRALFFPSTYITQWDKILPPFCRQRNGGGGELNGTIPAHLKTLYFTLVVMHWASEKQNTTQFSRATPTCISIISLLPHQRPSCWKASDYLLLHHPTHNEFAQALMKRKKHLLELSQRL